MEPLSGQFSLQIGPDQGEASQLATAIARAGAEQGLSCPAVVATTQVLERRLAVTSPPGDLILFKARCHPVRRRLVLLRPGLWRLTACARLGAERKATAALGTGGSEGETGEGMADWERV